MNPSEGLLTALNEIRETIVQDNKVYQEQFPVVDHYTSSQAYGQSLLQLPGDLRNRFIQSLVNRIAYTKFTMDYFENPLQELENDELPLGAIGQDIYVNPAQGRVYNIDDFAGLLAKYSADVKVEYTEINFDVQYPVTIIRKELEKAFVSWSSFEDFLLGISQSLYNAAYIDSYNYTRKLITNAYKNNAVQMELFSISTPNAPTKAELESLTERLQQAFLDFQAPSTEYNAWKKVGGYGRSILSWSKPEDIIVFVNNKFGSKLNVQVLANAFNIDKADLMGRVFYVPNFDIKDNDGNVIVDGSKIYAFICDRRWFKIRNKDMFMDEFYNANNRSWQNFLNVIKSYNYSLFANALMLVGEIPTVNPTSMMFNESSVTVEEDKSVKVMITTTPFNANATISVASGDSSVATATINGKEVTITGEGAGTTTITATCGTASATISVTGTAKPTPETTPATTPQ